MVTSHATSVKAYLDELPAGRRKALSAVRRVIRKSLTPGFTEGMQYGMLERWFKKAYAASGKKLNMGKSCVRFKTVDDLPLDVIGELISRVTVDDFIARYEAVKGPAKPRKQT